MRHRAIPALVFLAAYAGLSQAAPADHPGATKKQTVTKTAGSPATPGDAALEKDIRERLNRSKIAANKFTVRVQGGVATLEGRTDVLQHKGTATRLAKNAGAAAVVNKIEVGAAAKQKAASNLASGRRRAQVKRSEVANRK